MYYAYSRIGSSHTPHFQANVVPLRHDGFTIGKYNSIKFSFVQVNRSLSSLHLLSVHCVVVRVPVVIFLSLQRVVFSQQSFIIVNEEFLVSDVS